MLAAALAVTAGAALVQGFGRADATGLAWALVTVACEAAFTLLAVPVLARHGAVGVSVHTTGLAAVLLGVAGLVREGPGAVAGLGLTDVLVGLYLAVMVTAVAFVLWFSSVARLGAGTAGLLAGIAPVAAVAAGTALGGPVPSVTVLAGVAVVVAGLAAGVLLPRATVDQQARAAL